MPSSNNSWAPSSKAPPWLEFVRNIALGALLALGLERVYIRYGHSLSNRTMFARHFYLLAMTTTLIITVVQSSLTLSLGLIGALSIVRFRAAIKEPEELVYIFLAVGIGLALGANQLLVTILAFLTITGIIWLRHRFSAGEAENENNLFLGVVSRSPAVLTVPALTELLRERCRRFRLKRVDTTRGETRCEFSYRGRVPGFRASDRGRAAAAGRRGGRDGRGPASRCRHALA